MSNSAIVRLVMIIMIQLDNDSKIVNNCLSLLVELLETLNMSISILFCLRGVETMWSGWRFTTTKTYPNRFHIVNSGLCL